jgi:hypothetical protein
MLPKTDLNKLSLYWEQFLMGAGAVLLSDEAEKKYLISAEL